jgi:flagellar basal body-associated protein FliL
VPSLRSQSPENRSIDRLAIIRTLLVQVLVLLALSGAVIGYLKWSSDAAWSDFIAASKASAQEPKHQQHSAVPVQTFRGPVICARRA